METFPLAPRAFAGDARTVPAGNAIEWMRNGWAIFAAAPGVWVAIAVIILVAAVLLTLVPFLGQIASCVLMPVVSAGALQACRNTAQGRSPQIADLAWAFQHRTGPLAAVGLAYLAGTAALFAVLFVVVSGGALIGGASGGVLAALGSGLAAMLFGGLLVVVLMAPLLMAVTYAPALVAFNEMSAVDAMRASFFACLKNLGALTIFGIFFIIAGSLATAIAGLGWLVLLPMLFGTVYASYRDVFPSS